MLLVVWISAACGGDGAADSVTADAPNERRLAVVPTGEEELASDEAAITGTVVVSEGCPLLEVEGEGLAAVEFPAGAQLRDDGVTIALEDGATIPFHAGDVVTLAGGIGDVDRGMDVGSDALETCIGRSGATAVVFASGFVSGRGT